MRLTLKTRLRSRACLARAPLFPRRWAQNLANNAAIQERTLPFYQRKRYRQGNRPGSQQRYRTIAKLGYGAYSPVWLAWDERSKVYASLNICTQVEDSVSFSPVLNETNVLRRLKKFAERDHPRLDFMRLAQDIFEFNSPPGVSYCIVLRPQGNSVRVLQEKFPAANLPKLLVKSLIHHISLQNVQMNIDNDSSLKNVEDQETQDPSILLVTGATTLSGHPILADTGQMRLVEVLLQLPWGYVVDIWSIGVMTLEFMEGKNLFDPINQVIRQSPLFSTYFDLEANSSQD
ncbi:hypothetical protein BDV12DRAFT_183941 [Aspergillus spectabilis]